MKSRKGFTTRLLHILVTVTLLTGVFLFSGAIIPQVANADPAVPTAPSDLTATIVSATTVDLSWADNSADEDGFQIERAVDAGFTMDNNLMSVGPDIQAFSDDSLEVGVTYYYRVIAFNTSGSSAPSNFVIVSMVLPAAPYGLDADAQSATEVDLSWTDNSTNEDGFLVQRATNEDFDENLEEETVGTDNQTYTDEDVEPETTYYYRIIAYNTAGESAPSNTAEVTTPELPEAPDNLAASVVSGPYIELTWTDNSDDETGFEIERATDEDFTENVDDEDVGADVEEYVDDEVSANVTYYYKVIAYSDAGDSEPSNIVTIMITFPNAPTGLAATISAGGAVRLTWTDNAVDETGFLVERAEDGAFTSGVTAYTINTANVTGFYNTAVALNTTYYYRVYATNVAGKSGASNVVSETTPASMTPPGAVSGLKATAISSQQIDISWLDNSDNEAGFRVQRSLDAAGTSGVATNDFAYDTTLVHSIGLNPNTTYFYIVNAFNIGGASAAAGPVSATTPNATAPMAPSNLSAVKVTDNQISLSWTDNSDNETGFHIQTAVNENFAGSMTITVAANATTYSDNTVYAGDTFYYRVAAFNDSGDSSYSNVASVNIPLPAPVPSAPSNLRLVSINANVIKLAWNDNSLNEAGFQIDRDINSSFSTTSFASFITAADVITYDDAVTVDGTYYYRVKAFSAAGSSLDSNVLAVTIGNAASSSSDTGGGGGGLGGALSVSVDGLSSAASSLTVDGEGYVQQNVELANPEKDCSLVIHAGTQILDAKGDRLPTLTHAEIASPPAPPEDKAIVSAHEFGPDGAVFSPAIDLVIKYDPATIPAGVKSEDLVIAMWNGSTWQYLPCTVDTATNTVTAKVSHFTSFALLANAPAPAPQPTPAPTPTLTPATAPTTPAPTPAPAPAPAPSPTPTPEPQPSAPPAPFNWGIVIAIAGGIIVIGLFIYALRPRRGI